MNRKHCKICGIPKKTTFECGRCGRTACFSCFEFTTYLCKDCEIQVYNEKYYEKIRDYKLGTAAIV